MDSGSLLVSSGRSGVRRLAIGAATALLLVLVPTVAPAQCAMCRRALESPEGRQMIAAFRSGILLLLGAPFAVFGTVAGLAVRAFRRRNGTAPRL